MGGVEASNGNVAIVVEHHTLKGVVLEKTNDTAAFGLQCRQRRLYVFYGDDALELGG